MFKIVLPTAVTWLTFCALSGEAKLDCIKKLKNPKKTSCVKEFYSRYHSFEEIMSSIDILVNKTRLDVKVKTIGETQEGRKIKVIQIINAGKPHVFIQSGLHAREHIAQATGAFLVYDYLMKNRHVKDFNLHLLTVANPDGYVHSRENNKAWRKNMEKHKGSKCQGVDLNRNFGFKHGFSGTELKDKCSDVFGGHKPFTARESRAMRDYIEGLPRTPILGVDIHAYQNWLLYPYGYKKGVFPDNVDEIKELGEKAIKAVKGMVARPAAELGEASGAADDWMRGEACIRFVYTYELPDFGQKFWPDEKHILPTAIQIRKSIDIMLRHMTKLVKKESEEGTLKKKWCDMSGNGSKKAKKDKSKSKKKTKKYVKLVTELFGLGRNELPGFPSELPYAIQRPHYAIPGPYQPINPYEPYQDAFIPDYQSYPPLRPPRFNIPPPYYY